MTEQVRTLRSGFLSSAARFPERPAVTVGAEILSYRQLSERGRRIAATLDRHAPAGEGKLTAVFGHRHPTAIAGVLGALLRGHGYVPLNPAFPTERTGSMLQRARCHALVVDPTAAGQLDVLLAPLADGRVVLLPDADDVSDLRRRWPQHVFLGEGDLEPADGCALGAADPGDVAYLLFTSGSTGVPKGVMVAHRNVTAFLDTMVERYGITCEDRFSNTFDLTFDLSVFDLFCAWERGACVCVPTANEKMFPGKYVKNQRLTVWFSVPSTGLLMSRLRMLKPSSYETLRWALFCGEALPVEVVERFAEAAPNAVAENLYGPTELTIACTMYRWDASRSRSEAHLGVVPIGEPYPGMEVLVADEAFRAVPRGQDGELLMTGPQMALGYWEDPERTAQSFVRLSDSRIFYRTGDRVRWPVDGPLVYLGRIDNQLKIQGYRVELGEIEAALRTATGAEVAIAVGWPVTPSGADGVVAFVGLPAGELVTGDPDAIQRAMRDLLPAYMQPSRVVLLEEFPLNANGKVDRGALLARLRAEVVE